jgi:outer membrane protein
MTVIGASHANAASLLDVYDLAAQSDPTIRAAEATRLASREARPQAWAAFLPTISANADWSGTTSGSDTASLPGLSAAGLTGFSTTTRGGSWGISAVESINLPQTLRALNRTDYTLAQADITYRIARAESGVRATRYFNVLSAKDTLSAAQSNLDSLNQQLERAEKRFEVGLSAITDVQEARAQRDRSNATVISAKRTLATNQELLREVTGAAVDTLAAPRDDMPLLVPDPQSEEEWVRKALDGNLDLANNRISLETATHDVGTQGLIRFPASAGRELPQHNDHLTSMRSAENITNSWMAPAVAGRDSAAVPAG